MVFSKIMKRERSYYKDDKTISGNQKKAWTEKLNFIEKYIKSL